MNKEEMTIDVAKEIALKYANDIWLFGSVDTDCVSKVCKTLLNELDIANNKLKEVQNKLKHLKLEMELEDVTDIKKYSYKKVIDILSIIGSDK